MATEKRLIDANDVPELLEKEFARKWRLILDGETHLDNLAEGFFSAKSVIWAMPTVDAVEVKCEVGDYVYALWEAPVKQKYIIYCAEVKEIRISVRNCRLTTTYILEPIDYRGRRREYRDEEFGTLVFKEEADAERKLYPCEHCISGTYRSCDGCSYGERKSDG